MREALPTRESRLERQKPRRQNLAGSSRNLRLPWESYACCQVRPGWGRVDEFVQDCSRGKIPERPGQVVHSQRLGLPHFIKQPRQVPRPRSSSSAVLPETAPARRRDSHPASVQPISVRLPLPLRRPQSVGQVGVKPD